MENLIITSTKSTPEIDFNTKTGILSIKGQSYPENSFSFYKPVISWIKEFLDSENSSKISVILEIKYMNTSSTKSMMNIMDMFEKAHTSGKDISVKWFYDKENDSIKEVADEFKEDVRLPFEIIEKE